MIIQINGMHVMSLLFKRDRGVGRWHAINTKILQNENSMRLNLFRSDYGDHKYQIHSGKQRML